MPPKKNTRMESDASNPEIDAITADPLHPTKHIKWESPDGSSILYYNTNTLLEIGRRKGRLLEPPHFRAVATKELVDTLVELEGVERIQSYVSGFRVGKKGKTDGGRPWSAPPSEDDDDEYHYENLLMMAEVDDDEIQHHAAVQHVLDRFCDHVEPKELYMCRVCYEHVAVSRFIPAAEHMGTNGHVREGGFYGATGSGADEITLEGKLDTSLPFDVIEEMSDDEQIGAVFRYANDLKKHITFHHGDVWSPDGASEYRVRDYIIRFLQTLNEKKWTAHRYHHCYNTTQGLWARDYGYNRARYNRLFSLIEKARNSGRQDLTVFAFEGDQPLQGVNFVEIEVGEPGGFDNGGGTRNDCFIVDDDDEDVYEEEQEALRKAAQKKKKNKDKKKKGKKQEEEDGDCGICTHDDHSTTKCPFIVLDQKSLQPVYCGDAEAKRRRRYLKHREGDDELYTFGKHFERGFTVVEDKDDDGDDGEDDDSNDNDAPPSSHKKEHHGHHGSSSASPHKGKRGIKSEEQEQIDDFFAHVHQSQKPGSGRLNDYDKDELHFLDVGEQRQREQEGDKDGMVQHNLKKTLHRQKEAEAKRMEKREEARMRDRRTSLPEHTPATERRRRARSSDDDVLSCGSSFINDGDSSSASSSDDEDEDEDDIEIGGDEDADLYEMVAYDKDEDDLNKAMMGKDMPGSETKKKDSSSSSKKKGSKKQGNVKDEKDVATPMAPPPKRMMLDDDDE